MKIRSVSIENFKSIDQMSINFVDDLTGNIRPITALFGDNGSGKTTILQAIALILSMATWKTRNVNDFQWHGFLADRIRSLGETRLEMELQLEDDEIDAVQEIFTIWKGHRSGGFEDTNFIQPRTDKRITLVYEGGRVRSAGGFGQAVELLGRHYTKEIIQYDRRHRHFFDRVGDVFWFDQYRNLGSGILRNTEESEDAKVSWQAGVAGLREYLIGWWMHHEHAQNKSDQDFIVQLEQKFARIFKGASFAGLEPMPVDHAPKPSDFYFLIKRANTRYDFSEMSSGEQAVFAVLYTFVRQQIARSIVLIDELELHLHPPEQQALYNSLRRLGPDCQYIITSHSPYLSDIIPEGYKIRLEGGRRCL